MGIYDEYLEGVTDWSLMEDFQNPPKYWTSLGSFEIELNEEIDLNGADTLVVLQGKTLKIEKAQIVQGSGETKVRNFAITLQGGFIRIPYMSIRKIRDGNGKLLFVNKMTKPTLLETEEKLK